MRRVYLRVYTSGCYRWCILQGVQRWYIPGCTTGGIYLGVQRWVYHGGYPRWVQRWVYHGGYPRSREATTRRVLGPFFGRMGILRRIDPSWVGRPSLLPGIYASYPPFVGVYMPPCTPCCLLPGPVPCWLMFRFTLLVPFPSFRG